MTTKLRFRAGLVLVAAVLIGLRVFDLAADPPVDLDWSGGIFFDEGMLAQGARNRILFGDFFQDEWNDFYISPLLSLFKLAVFSVTGIGLIPVRLVPVGFGLLPLALFYQSRRATGGDGAARGGPAGCNHVFVMFNRSATETPVVFFMLLSESAAGGLRGLRAGLRACRGLTAWLSGPERRLRRLHRQGLPYFIGAALTRSLAWWRCPRR
jgi:hypothetical protein